MKPTHIRRLLDLHIPAAIGLGSQSTTIRSISGYCADAEFLLSGMSEVESAYIELRANGRKDNLWSEPEEYLRDPELLVLRMEAWHAARKADGWSMERAGARQPGAWRDMPLYPIQVGRHGVDDPD